MKKLFVMLMCVYGVWGFADDAVNFLKSLEGIVKRNGMHVVYDDANPKNTYWDGKESYEDFAKRCKGKPTIGYGFTAKNMVKKCAITDKEADEHLVIIIKRIRERMSKDIKVSLNSNQEIAIIAFIYNVGYANFLSSTLLKKLNNKDYIGASKEFIRWHFTTVNGRKVVSKGLVNRRFKEKTMFMKNYKPQRGIAYE